MNTTTARLVDQHVLANDRIFAIFFKRSPLPLVAMVISVLLTALSVIYITNATRSLHANIQQTAAEKERLHIEWGQLLLERSTWIMQARIQNLAEGKLAMHTPDVKSVVVINE